MVGNQPPYINSLLLGIFVLYFIMNLTHNIQEDRVKNKISSRCGKGTCEHFCGRIESESKCRIYDDRRDCPTSMKHRKKVVKHSRERQQTRWW